MRGFVSNTDPEWFTKLAARRALPDEVVFWRAGTERFRALRPGEPFFLKLRSPLNAIAGFGLFSHFSALPLSAAWRLCGSSIGAFDRDDLRARLASARARLGMRAAKGDPGMGCIVLFRPVLFPEHRWVEVPGDFGSNVGQGKIYDLSRGDGRRIWHECRERMGDTDSGEMTIRDASRVPAMAVAKLGPVSFRLAVLDAYGRRCAITGESELGALDAVRIREYGDARDWSIANGIAMCSDLAGLFDAGYLSVDPGYRVVLSRGLAARNSGRGYATLEGRPIHVPYRKKHRPLAEALWWHNEERFVEE